MHRVHRLVIVFRTSLVVSIKGSLSLLHLGTHDSIRLLITRCPRMIRVLRSGFVGRLRPL